MRIQIQSLLISFFVSVTNLGFAVAQEGPYWPELGNRPAGDGALSSQSTLGGSSSRGAFKQLMEAAQPDAVAILQGGPLTDVFADASAALEQSTGREFKTEREAALAILAQVE